MRTSAHSPFRLPPESRTDPYVDVPAHEGDVVTAVLTTPPPDNKTYSAALRAPAPHNTTPVVLRLAAGPQGPTPPAPQPAPGLTITPLDGEGDVLTLDPAPGNDNIVVVN